MRKQLIDLREKMKENGIAAYIVPTTDFHGSEYVHEYFQCREYVSGFTGSAGTLAVTEDVAALWTDGRYFLQAAQQLEGSGIELMREGEVSVPELIDWLKMQRDKANSQHESKCGTNCDNKWKVAFDGRVVDLRFGKKLEENFCVCGGLDLVGEIWSERPQLKGNAVYSLPLSVTGESAEGKLNRLRTAMLTDGADCHIITSLEEIAWLFNLRGSDILHTPVFYSFVLILPQEIRVYLLNTEEKTVSLFGDVSSEKLIVKPYFDIFSDLKKLENVSMMFNEKTTSYGLAKAFCENTGIKTILKEDPAMLMKAVKNETEIACTKQAHIRDGAAVTEFIYRLKMIAEQSEDELPLTELSAADMLWQERKRQGAYDTSFDTIVAYGEHGAIIHYEPTAESDIPLLKSGFLLVDSGGQYSDGTTDITRTIALGELTDEMKRCYTAVLKGHIALATACFDETACGTKLDEIARKPLKDSGMDYKHGTGHGVGHLLGVHEGPNTISPRGKNSFFMSGMITSNEPGVYIEGKFGIRLENEILCVDAGRTADSSPAIEHENGKMLAFETITFCPFERKAILTELLTSEEKAWLNAYHAEVFEKISPLLTADAKQWLARQTAAF